MKIIIGIDPGLNGGIAIFGDITENGAGCAAFKTMMDTGNLLDGILTVKKPSEIKAFVEVPPVFFAGAQGGISTQAKLHRNLGQYEGLLMGLGIPFETVTPQIWQRGLPGLAKLAGKDRKKALHNLATQRFPQLKPTLKTCDAILIAEYGKRKELGDER